LIEEKFASHGSECLARSFPRRLSFLHESPAARTIVRSWLSPDGLLGDITQLNDLGEAMLENVAPVDPEAALAALERVARITDVELSTVVLSRHIQLICSIA
jgi:predicted ATP-grasp superfamily ATP-dependent carboligase